MRIKLGRAAGKKAYEVFMLLTVGGPGPPTRHSVIFENPSGTEPRLIAPTIFYMPAQPARPVFVRLPSGPDRCPQTGLTRGYLHDLTVPCRRNAYRPAVASFLVGRGHRGVRLVCLDSLVAHLGGSDGCMAGARY